MRVRAAAGRRGNDDSASFLPTSLSSAAPIHHNSIRNEISSKEDILDYDTCMLYKDFKPPLSTSLVALVNNSNSTFLDFSE